VGNPGDTFDLCMQEQTVTMRIVDKLAVPVIFIAGGMAYLAEKFELPFLIPLAIAVFGAFALLFGADTFIQGRIQLFDRYYSRREYYSGLSARLLGVIIFLFGTGILLYSASEWFQPGKANQFLTSLVESNRGWGILLIVFGFFTPLFGIIRLISGSAHSPEQRSLWVDLGFRVQGLIGTVFGALLLAVGIWLMFFSIPIQ